MMMKKSNVMDEKELRAKHRGEAWSEKLVDLYSKS